MNISRCRKKKKNTIAAARDAFHCTRFNFSVSSFCLIACACACVRVCVCFYEFKSKGFRDGKNYNENWADAISLFFFLSFFFRSENKHGAGLRNCF